MLKKLIKVSNIIATTGAVMGGAAGAKIGTEEMYDISKDDNIVWRTLFVSYGCAGGAIIGAVIGGGGLLTAVLTAPVTIPIILLHRQ